MDERKPTDQRIAAKPDEEEAREKGGWVEASQEGIVPAEDGGSDAPSEMLAEDPELKSAALGRPAESDEPATEGGIDASAGDRADALTDGGPDTPDDAEPDLKDGMARQPMLDDTSSG